MRNPFRVNVTDFQGETPTARRELAAHLRKIGGPLLENWSTFGLENVGPQVRFFAIMLPNESPKSSTLHFAHFCNKPLHDTYEEAQF